MTDLGWSRDPRVQAGNETVALFESFLLRRTLKMQLDSTVVMTTNKTTISAFLGDPGSALVVDFRDPVPEREAVIAQKSDNLSRGCCGEFEDGEDA